MKVDTVVIVGVVALIAIAVYLLDPTFFGLLGKREGFYDASMPDMVPTGGSASTTSTGEAAPGQMDNSGANNMMQDMMASGAQLTDDQRRQLNAAMGGTTSGFQNGGSASASEGFESGPADFGNATAPAGCYPRDQLTATELLPKDGNSVWAQQNPMGPGSLKGKNFLSAGALVGINTVGQSMKNANLQLRSEPPNPQVPISIFNNSTIEPDFNRRPLEIN
jgi:hypothetical protein